MQKLGATPPLSRGSNSDPQNIPQKKTKLEFLYHRRLKMGHRGLKVQKKGFGPTITCFLVEKRLIAEFLCPKTSCTLGSSIRLLSLGTMNNNNNEYSSSVLLDQWFPDRNTAFGRNVQCFEARQQRCSFFLIIWIHPHRPVAGNQSKLYFTYVGL